MVYNLICHVAFINTSEILNFEGKEGFCAYKMHVHATLYFARLYSCFHQSGKLFELQEKQNSFREHVHPFIHSSFSCIMISFLI